MWAIPAKTTGIEGKSMIRAATICLLAALGLGAGACGGKRVVLELNASIQYEKPVITSVSHDLTDSRREGGTVAVSVTVYGDPGLEASFDITPGIVNQQPMREVADGRYVGQYAFSPDAVGGPFTIIGRLRHEEAGEVVLRDPDSVSISLLR
jgi:hypothetical protein